jgi:hypothetical protein
MPAGYKEYRSVTWLPEKDAATFLNAINRVIFAMGLGVFPTSWTQTS